MYNNMGPGHNGPHVKEPKKSHCEGFKKTPMQTAKSYGRKAHKGKRDLPVQL